MSRETEFAKHWPRLPRKLRRNVERCARLSISDAKIININAAYAIGYLTAAHEMRQLNHDAYQWATAFAAHMHEPWAQALILAQITKGQQP